MAIIIRPTYVHDLFSYSYQGATSIIHTELWSNITFILEINMPFISSIYHYNTIPHKLSMSIGLHEIIKKIPFKRSFERGFRGLGKGGGYGGRGERFTAMPGGGSE